MAPPVLRKSEAVDKEQLWAWEYQMEEEKHDLYMDIGEEVRFRVSDEIFVDTTPSSPENAAGEEIADTEVKKAPYTIVGTISEPGLGLLSWWNTG
ncbi:DNA-directed RNA polymerase III subunit RPC8-like [Pecten maximus]|uniref:DNA-directed RNA polymerase III subunit RPC8-like n=1 Tax=Pecten maximus TaxID=6579 RepID=UPI001458E3AD|nr:DNA-directed RNA polymerase III subunit RPC8-like [Pecten maximus]